MPIRFCIETFYLKLMIITIVLLLFLNTGLLANDSLAIEKDLELDSLALYQYPRFENISYADSVVFYDSGAMGENTGGEPDQIYQKPELALGEPDSQCVGLGSGGNLVLYFKDNVIINGPGPDLYIYQTDTMNEEILVWISDDGIRYQFVGRTSIDSPYVDIEQVAEVGKFYSFVKVRDNSDQGEQSGPVLGANIDAVSAIHTARKIIFPSDSLFKGENTTWRKSGYRYISDIARLINRYENIQIKIFVHSQQVGTSYFNQIISHQRASAIKTYLVDQKFFNENEVHAYGMGNEYPLKNEIAGQPLSINRRVEIFIHPAHLNFPVHRR